MSCCRLSAQTGHLGAAGRLDTDLLIVARGDGYPALRSRTHLDAEDGDLGCEGSLWSRTAGGQTSKTWKKRLFQLVQSPTGPLLDSFNDGCGREGRRRLRGRLGGRRERGAGTLAMGAHGVRWSEVGELRERPARECGQELTGLSVSGPEPLQAVT